MATTWNQDTLKSLVTAFDIILKDDARIESYREDTMFRGSPDAVIRARDEADVRAAMKCCAVEHIPMTFCGSRTSMTGASIATEGVEIATERLEGIVDVSSWRDQPVIVARTGTITAAVQKAAAETGWYFPVSPTSRDDCRIGANVATNATGEDSYQYGPIRPYVRRLKVLLADGTEKILERAPGEQTSWEKNRAGYLLDWKNPIDLFIGSEGTLGFISEVTLDLIPRVPHFFSALVPFASSRAALAWIVTIASQQTLKPRALELVDSGALAVMRTHADFPRSWSDDVQALVYFKQEYADDDAFERVLLHWYEAIQKKTTAELAEQILVGQSNKEKEMIRLLRHHIPQTINERARAFWDAGGGKVGSDWWVPIPKLLTMMDYFYRQADALGLPYMAYAHVGSGHPHTNIIVKNKIEKEKAEALLIACCRKAVALGGGVAGEHGIGKIHRNLLPIQHPPAAIAQMHRWKQEYDPQDLLGRGNIFAI